MNSWDRLRSIKNIRLSTVAVRTIWTLAIVVCAMNVFLLANTSRLKAALSQQTGETPSGALTELVGTGLDGKLRRVQLNGGLSYLVLTYSEGCPYCRASIEGWKRLTATADRSRWGVVWVSRDNLERTQAFAISQGITSEIVLAEVPYRVYLQLGMARVPRSMVFSPVGATVSSFLGVVSPTKEQQIAQLLHDPNATSR
ncbi:MAG TPA: hypothetical protein VJN96_17545 [Vicinamibacterales bacterium]|nr:hypothetical protein [Vicinamibacterales bacterium]